jgi:Cdc6-like AAA superfamily ATPase
MDERQDLSEPASSHPRKVFDQERERCRGFASDLGRLFELGFNAGLLATITQRKNIQTHFGTLYENDLCQIRFPALAAVMYKRLGLLSPYDRNALEIWLLFFIQKGYLAGMNFLAEYLSKLEEDSQGERIDLVYLQCSCSGKNSLDLYDQNERTHARQMIAQFRSQHASLTWTEQDFQDYSRLGHFLNADTLLLFHIGKSWRMLCIDESVFSLGTSEEAADLTRVEHLKHLLARELHYTRAKSAFANLSIDTDPETASASILSEHLQEYFTAFKREDKESIKFIQAASYAWSFYHFLLSKGILSTHDSLIFNVVGYTDRSINAMSVHKTQVHLLETCAAIYQKRNKQEEIDQARDTVLETIRNVAARSFHDGQTFMNRLVHLADEGERVRWLVHTETLSDFINTRLPMDVQSLPPGVRNRLTPEQYKGKNILDIHQALTEQVLAGPAPYLFLTGHPGVGKTTAIVNFLKARESEGEGFLFLYISPRKQVNQDIIRKFRTAVTGRPPCAHLCAVTAHSLIIHNNYGSPTVHYYAPDRTHTFEANGVTFIHAESEQAEEQRTQQRQFAEIQEGLLVDKGEQTSGVLNSLSRALQTLINGDWPQKKALVATVAIQSLKRTASGTTLQHLERVFQGIANEGRVIPAKLRQLAQRVRHIFVMIDEVTGDESGVEFLSGIHQLLSQYGLLNSESGINTKIIVADASIIDPKIIKRHLEKSTYEPHKIYFGYVAPDEPLWPISLEEIRFKHKPALVINANAYPASPLHLTYKTENYPHLTKW